MFPKMASQIYQKLPNKYITNNYNSARTFSKLESKIISTQVVLGDIVQLKIRLFYWNIKTRNSWDSKFNINMQRLNMMKLNIKSFYNSDARNTGLISIRNNDFTLNVGKNVQFHRRN